MATTQVLLPPLTTPFLKIIHSQHALVYVWTWVQLYLFQMGVHKKYCNPVSIFEGAETRQGGMTKGKPTGGIEREEKDFLSSLTKI